MTFKDLDTNQHVNNAQYISMILDQLDCTDDLHELRAEYKKQAVLGDIIIPRYAVRMGAVMWHCVTTRTMSLWRRN